MEIDVSLLNLVIKEYVFGTLKSSLPVDSPVKWKVNPFTAAQLLQ